MVFFWKKLSREVRELRWTFERQTQINQEGRDMAAGEECRERLKQVPHKCSEQNEEEQQTQTLGGAAAARLSGHLEITFCIFYKGSFSCRCSTPQDGWLEEGKP